MLRAAAIHQRPVFPQPRLPAAGRRHHPGSQPDLQLLVPKGRLSDKALPPSSLLNGLLTKSSPASTSKSTQENATLREAPAVIALPRATTNSSSSLIIRSKATRSMGSSRLTMRVGSFICWTIARLCMRATSNIRL